MTALDDFIADARKVTLETVFDLVGGVPGRQQGNEYVGPCPACGGRDRFSINFVKQVWRCRQNDRGNGDGLALMAHKMDLDLGRRADMLLACSEVQSGRPVPDGGEQESDEDRAAREKRMEDRRRADDARKQKNKATETDFRAREIEKARGIWGRAVDGLGSPVETYLCRRTGATALPHGVWENLAFIAQQTYWHGQDERGNPVDIHCGPAMIAPMVDPVGHFGGKAGRITGCHQTWIDLDRAPKFRPGLFARTESGRKAGRPELADAHGRPDDADLDAGHYEALPTKKMRGHKKGSLIPVFGDLSASRWVVAEGIETVSAVGVIEGWRADTFYAAAGDINNIGGPAEPKSAFNHPVLKKQDSKGRWKPVRVPGPVPKADSLGEAFGLPDHVTELVLPADGDSEFVKTASDMARAEARLGREGLAIATWWPPEGVDWADLALRAAKAKEGDEG